MNVWEVCEFSDEIKFGKLDRKTFAVELYEVLSGQASDVYQDPAKFLTNTYLTSDMRRLLSGALVRLARNEGNAVYILDTEFGGGKTHSLLLLYHIFGNPDLGNNYIRSYGIDKEYGILEVPSVRVIAIDCRRMEKNTLWGQLAHIASKYDIMKDFDLQKIPPKNVDLIKALFDAPTLILIDELPIYLVNAAAEKVGDTNLMELTLNFLTVLISAVSTSEKTMLVLTLTGKQSLYERYVEEVKKRIKKAELQERVEGVHDYFSSSVSRQAQYLVPVRDLEIYEVIRRRLVKKIKDANAREVVDSYYNYYLEKGLIDDPNYRKKMEMAYPFHPFLIDVLHERVATIEKFNRTRGALWLLATILHRIYRDKAECSFVTAGDIPLEDATIRDALTSQLDRSSYINAVNTDVIEKAKQLDERKNIKIARRMARSIFLYSLIATAKISGIRPGQIKLAVCRPGEDPSIVDEILYEMEREFWYLRKEGSEYYFWIDPGINKVIYDYKKEVTEEDIRDKMLSTLKKLFKGGNGFRIVWDPDDLDDSSEFRIFVSLKPLSKDEIEGILNITPTGKPREYKNNLVFVFPDKDLLEDVWRSAREVCAIEKAEKDERIKQDRTKIKELRNRKNDAEGSLTASCESAFIKIAYPRIGGGGIEPEEIHPLIDEKKRRGPKNLTELALKHLRDRMKLIDALNPESILDVSLVKNELKRSGYVRVSEIYEAFRRDRRLPFVASGEAIITAVKKGVEESKFGYADKLEEVNGKFRAKIGKSVSISWDGFVIHKDLVYEEIVKPPVKSGPPSGEVVVEPIAPPRPKKNRWEVEVRSINSLKDSLSKLVIVKTLGNIETALSVKIMAEGDEIEIRSNLSNVNRLKNFLDRLSEYYPQAQISGTIKIESEEDVSDELKNYGLI